MGNSGTRSADIPRVKGEIMLHNGGTFLSAEWERPYFNGPFQYRIKLYRYVAFWRWQRVAIYYANTEQQQKHRYRYCFANTKPGEWYKVKVGLENQHFRRGPTQKSKKIKYTPLTIKDLSAEKKGLQIVVSWRKIGCKDVKYLVQVHAEGGLAQRPIPTLDNGFKLPLLPHKKLSFEVWAEHGEEKGPSKRTEKISTGPEPVTNLRAQRDRDCIAVTWNSSDDSVKEYHVKVLRQGKFICEVPTLSRQYTLTRYKPAKKYCFEVWAIDHEDTNGPRVKSDVIKSPKRPPRDTGHHQESRNPVFDSNSRVEEVDTLLTNTSRRVRVLPPMYEADPDQVRLNLREGVPEEEEQPEENEQNATEAEAYFDQDRRSTNGHLPRTGTAPKVVYNIKEVRTNQFGGLVETLTDIASSQQRERVKGPDEAAIGRFSASEGRSS